MVTNDSHRVLYAHLAPGTIPAQLFDVYLPIMSLTHVLGIDADSIPSQVPYLSAPTNANVSRVADSDRPKVGLVWKGSPTHKRERHRACGLDAMLELAQADCDFYSLQTPLSEDEQTKLRAAGVTLLEATEPHLTNFGKTAALIEQLDLVVSIDTSVAHLAGALGKPVWILLDHAPDWRWLTAGETSAWYPSARLIRKPREQSWAEFVSGSVRPLLAELAFDPA